MTIVVTGLGPGPASMLTQETAALLAGPTPVILRTRRHPTVAEISGSATWRDCDDLYAGATDFDAVYTAIVARVLDAAGHGDVIYAVPGHPLMAERSVTLLLAAARSTGVQVRVLPAVSYVDVASAALGVDFRDVQLCDALEDPRIDPRRPALISQLFDRGQASGLKLQLLEWYPADHRATVLHALGSGQESVTEVALAELDHRPWSYLDALFVPALGLEADLRRLEGLRAIVETLHAPGGCPWDREQTHRSLRPHLLEESYEVLEAIDSGDPAQLTEELGDLLLQVLMHAEVAEREGTFTLADVVEGIAAKLIRRHPHVFGEAQGADAATVYRNWDALKRQEKPRQSILDGVPAVLPALAASQSIQGRARRTGFDWPDMAGPLDKLREEIVELAQATGPAAREDEFGDILFVAVGIAQRLGIDAEHALRGANAKFRRRFAELERMASGRGLDLAAVGVHDLLALWAEAKSTSDRSL